MLEGRGRPIKWDQQTCLEAVRRFEEHCREANLPPTFDYYDEWRKDRSDAPSGFTIQRMFSSWNHARSTALAGNEQLHLHRFPGWTAERCLQALIAFQTHCIKTTDALTYDNYRRWQQTRQDAPSAFTIEKVFGSWKTAVSNMPVGTDQEAEA